MGDLGGRFALHLGWIAQADIVAAGDPNVSLFRNANQVSQNSWMERIALHLSENDVAHPQRRSDGSQISFGTRYAQDGRIADDAVTAAAGEVGHHRVGKAISKTVERRIAGFVVEAGDGDAY